MRLQQSIREDMLFGGEHLHASNNQLEKGVYYHIGFMYVTRVTHGYLCVITRIGILGLVLI
jgi:hypothetical protein